MPTVGEQMNLAPSNESHSRVPGRTGGIFAPSTPAISRRVVLKASALFTALATGAFSGGTEVFPRAAAQDLPPITSFDWIESEQIDRDLIGTGVAFEVVAPFPFSSVGASWSAATGDWPTLLIELSENGNDYSNIFSIGASAESGPDGASDRVFSSLVCASQGSSIRYRAIDDEGNPVEIPELIFTFIDSRTGPVLNDFPVSISAKAAWDGSAPPAFLTRADWGADESYRFEEDGEWWTRQYQLVEHAIIHHSETPNSQDPFEAIRSIYYYHAVTRGWHDIGYNYLVDKYGNIYEGRAGGRNVVGGHAYEYAHGSTGICFIGEFFDDEVTEEALAAMVAILAWTCRDLDPLGRGDFHSQSDLPTICAHRDVNIATCPGDKAYAELPILRDLVAQTLSNFANGPVADLVSGDQARTQWSTALRATAGVNSEEMLTLSEYVVGVITAGPLFTDGMPWYRLSTDYGEGWVDYSALVRDPPIDGSSGHFSREDMVELTDTVNLRRVPGIRAEVVEQASRGTAGLIVAGPADADGYRWYRIMTGERFAWVASTFLTWSDQPIPERPIPTTDLAVSDVVAVVDGPLQLHRTPGIGDDTIATLETGAVGIITAGPEISDNQLWFELRTTTLTGWVAASWLALSDTPPPPIFIPGDAIVVSDGPVNMRQVADDGAAILAELPTGETGVIVAGPVSWNGYVWYEIETMVETGWVTGTYLSQQ